jgi:hypothetical protein
MATARRGRHFFFASFALFVFPITRPPACGVNEPVPRGAQPRPVIRRTRDATHHHNSHATISPQQPAPPRQCATFWAPTKAGWMDTWTLTLKPWDFAQTARVSIRMLTPPTPRIHPEHPINRPRHPPQQSRRRPLAQLFGPSKPSPQPPHFLPPPTSTLGPFVPTAMAKRGLAPPLVVFAWGGAPPH